MNTPRRRASDQRGALPDAGVGRTPHETLDLDDIRACMEGTIPGVMATCDGDGMPNVTYVSQVEYVDARQLALSFQFFNKTRRNVLANPHTELLVVHPRHGAMYRIAARYLRTESEGAVFERMRAKLAGIASHSGMAGVFHLRGADLYAVERVEQVLAPQHAGTLDVPNRLSMLRRAALRVAAAADFDALVELLLDAVVQEFGIAHALLLMLDAGGQRLYTVASRGYAHSGAGAEILLGDGVIGVAARLATPIRINHATTEYSYVRTMREGVAGHLLGREIPLPGLAAPGSQLALPLACGGELLGVLYVESPQDLRFDWDDEDALLTLATQAALQLNALGAADAESPEGEAAALPATSPTTSLAAPPPTAQPLRVRHYAVDDSVFLDDDYLIKGVAGAVLWQLLGEHAATGRCDFSNRELRLAPQLRLPEVGDNLEARLVLLTRRLVDRDAALRIEKTGRGRFRLCLARPLQLSHVPR
ncbi:MAG TPA: GAF domain-containing protein [Rubrivivax sp.]|nr:GAF domain-containing protein [Rubrivivax sp.]HPO19908.1 GAF domain-containing protein [Rubrivivax sp.]